VFGRESGGFGIVGDDGHRDDRLEALARTAALLREHGDLLDGYRPDAARVGVVLEPATYQLDWAGTLGGGLTASQVDPFQAGHSVHGYLRALERLQIPYDVVDPVRTADLDAYRLLILPWPLVVDPAFARRALAWTRAGGLLLVEAELDAFDGQGLYRYHDERPFANALGLRGLGRRPLDGRDLAFTLDGVSGTVGAATWLVPFAPGDAEVLARDEHGATIVRRSIGDGAVVAVGSHPGLADWHAPASGLATFLHALATTAGALPALRCDMPDGERVQWRCGRSGDGALLFVLDEDGGTDLGFSWPASALPAVAARDVVTGATVDVAADGDRRSLRLRGDAGGVHVVRLTLEAP
jgi:beta-galactosidase